MRRITAVMTVWTLFQSMALAAEFKAGGHGGYTLGGDIEDEDVAWGGQVGATINENIALELAVSGYSDETTESDGDFTVDAELDVVAIALTGQLHFPLAARVKGYAGAGAGYYLLDSEIGIDVGSLAEQGIGASASADVDDEFGFHLAGGFTVSLAEQLELFAEYRYAFVDVGGDFTATLTDAGGTSATVSDSVDGSFDHGLFRVGLNLIL